MWNSLDWDFLNLGETHEVEAISKHNSFIFQKGNYIDTGKTSFSDGL